MRFLSNFPILFFVVFAIPVAAQKNIMLSSPGHDITFSLRQIKGTIVYSISFKGEKIIDNSSLGLQFDNANFENDLNINTAHFKDTTEDYELFAGKTKQVHSHYKQAIITIEKKSPHKKINLIVRAFDDGIAFRYEFPKQQNEDSFTLLDENTTFRLAGNPTVNALLLPNYTSSHEGLYTRLPLNEIKTDTLMAMPALLEFQINIFLAIPETELIDIAGMHLS